MTYVPPFPEPRTATKRLILTTGLVPALVGGVNSKTAVFSVAADATSSYKIVSQWFHNTHFSDSYSVSWATSWSPFVTYSPGATTAGTGDPGIELGAITLKAQETAVFSDPIVLNPGESFYAAQVKAGTLTGQAITLKLYAEQEPL